MPTCIETDLLYRIYKNGANSNFHFFGILLIFSNNSMMSVPGLIVSLLKAARCLVRDQTARHRRMQGDDAPRDGKCLFGSEQQLRC